MAPPFEKGKPFFVSTQGILYNKVTKNTVELHN